jgi:hypothetical protein
MTFRSRVAVLVVIAAAFMGPSVAVAKGRQQAPPHTVTWWCVDLNELWDVHVPVVVGAGDLEAPVPSPLPPCRSTSTFPVVVKAGSNWTTNAYWYTNRSYSKEVKAALKTTGYHFAAETPAQDFLSKVTEVRYLTVALSPGGPSFLDIFDAGPNAHLVKYGDLFGATPTSALVNPALGIDISARDYRKLPLIGFPAVASGLPPGSYEVYVSVVLSELHNDGLGLDDGDFLPAGETYVAVYQFEVAP